ncbi:MAG: MaoC/PaaZ C-terminal domain-containing protein [Chloroflexi bacterium]|nr:MaoC/PaaZ C-terminal domain-containing protein [Chloroflexota bacterium]
MMDESRPWNNIKEGDGLPVETRRITRVDVVAMAFATRDFLPPVHIDHEVAQAAGLKDINVNIIATGGLISKYLTDWSGPKGVLKSMKYSLATSVYPGDTLTQTGKVMKRYTEGGQHLVDVEYSFSVAAGVHAWGTATLVLQP